MLALAAFPPEVLSLILRWCPSAVLSLWKSGDKQLATRLLAGGCRELSLRDPDARSVSRWPKLIGSGLRLTLLDLDRYGYVAHGSAMIEECIKSLPKTLQSLRLKFENSLDFVAHPSDLSLNYGYTHKCYAFRDLKFIVPSLTELLVTYHREFPGQREDRIKTYLDNASLLLLPRGLRSFSATKLIIGEEADLASLLPESLTSLTIALYPSTVSSWPPNLTYIDPYYVSTSSAKFWSTMPRSLTALSYSNASNQKDPFLCRLPPQLTSLSISEEMQDGAMFGLPANGDEVEEEAEKSAFLERSWISSLPTSLTLLDIWSPLNYLDLRALPQTITSLSFKLDFGALEEYIITEAILSGSIIPLSCIGTRSPTEDDFEVQQLMELRRNGTLTHSFWPRNLRSLLLNTSMMDTHRACLEQHIYFLPSSLERLDLELAARTSFNLEVASLFPTLRSLNVTNSAKRLVFSDSLQQCQHLEALEVNGAIDLPKSWSLMPKSLEKLKLDNCMGNTQIAWLQDAGSDTPPGLRKLLLYPLVSLRTLLTAPIGATDLLCLPSTLTSLVIRSRSFPLQALAILPPTIETLTTTRVHSETLGSEVKSTYHTDYICMIQSLHKQRGDATF